MNRSVVLLLVVFAVSDPAAGDDVVERCRRVLEAVEPPGEADDDAALALARCEPPTDSRASAEVRVECYVETFRSRAFHPNVQDEIEKELEAQARRSPDDAWLRLSLGWLRPREPKDLAEEDFRLAIGLFEEAEDPRGEAIARLALARQVLSGGQQSEGAEARWREAATLIDKAEQIATRLAEPVLQALVLSRRAQLHLRTGRHLRQAHRYLIDAERILSESGAPHREWSFARYLLDVLSRELGDAATYREEQLELACEPGRISEVARAAIELAVSEINQGSGSDWRPKVRAAAELALQAAERSNYGSIEVQALHLLGDLSRGEQDLESARERLSACLERSRTARWGARGACQAAYAAFLSDGDPGRAAALMDEAISEMSKLQEWRSLLYNAAAYFEVLWATRELNVAVTRSLRVLDFIEAQLDLQALPQEQAELQSAWISVYDMLAGRLLEAAGDEPGTGSVESVRVEDALEVMERRRLRVLLERIRSAKREHTPPTPNTTRALVELRDLRGDRVALNRELLRLASDDLEREREISARLAEIEREEEELLRKLVESSPEHAEREPSALASLEEIQGALDPNEAMLYYQTAADEDLAGRFEGGSWVLAITGRAVSRYELQSQSILRNDAMNNNMAWTRRTGVGDPVSLRRVLLPEVVFDDLPPKVDHLIIVADGELHKVPFSLLQESDQTPPLVLRFHVSYALSATLFAELRHRPRSEATTRLLALADPVTERRENERRAADRRGWELGQSLSPLRCANEEVDRARRALGKGSVVLVGDQASEAQLKRRLEPAAVCHFAAHAVADEEHPGRSAILLAPGSPEEDGFLQPHEIAQLDMGGALVVLATCSSGGGKLLPSEGLQSLARPFLIAGARAVIATLRPIDDCHTVSLIDALYRNLADGHSVASALAGAQRERRKAGDPASEWGAFIALGDAGHVPFPGGLPPNKVFVPYEVLVAAALLLLVGFAGRILLRR